MRLVFVSAPNIMLRTSRQSCKILFCTLLLTAVCGHLDAQFTLTINEEGSPSATTNFKSQNAALDHLKKLQSEAFEKGNLLYSIDRYDVKGDSAVAFIHPGDHPNGVILDLNLEKEVPAMLARKRRRLDQQPVDSKALQDFFEESLTQFEDEGYPFARVKFTRKELLKDTLFLSLDIEPGPLMLIDSMVIKSNDKMSRRYLSNYLELSKGSAYSESQMRSLSSKLKEIAFVQAQKSPEVLFTKSGADVYLYLNTKKANTFNGILGLQPDAETGDIVITGDLDLKLENVLNKGEKLNFQWRRLQTETQELKIGAIYPYIFSTQIGVSGNIEVFRRDTTYSELITGLSFLYLIKGNDYLRVFFESRNSNSLADGIGNISLADAKTKAYGLGMKLDRVDFRLNPSKGYRIDAQISLGDKTIQVPDPENTNINKQEKLAQFRLSGQGDVFIPIGGRSTFRIGSNGGWIEASQVFENEMSRIGGISTIRGFDEASILASAYAIASFEYRFLLDETSALYTFFDQGWYENKNPEGLVIDRPYGFGLGLNFQTKPGIFTLTYALGSQFHGPVLFRNAKVHFGFVSLF